MIRKKKTKFVPKKDKGKPKIKKIIKDDYEFHKKREK